MTFHNNEVKPWRSSIKNLGASKVSIFRENKILLPYNKEKQLNDK